MMKSLPSLLVVGLLLSSAPHLCAQSYPNQAISLVIPLAPGDAGDVAGRTMAEELSKLLKVSRCYTEQTRRGTDDRHRRRSESEKGWIYDPPDLEHCPDCRPDS